MRSFSNKHLQLFAVIFLLTGLTFAQNVKAPRPSPNATVTQTVGVTDITIDYSSPGVKGRKIWGGLVPYGEIWRTGANEVTSITFSDPVSIKGNKLEAGTYGVHTIPGETEWQIIFSGDTEVDAGSTFEEEKEVLRINVSPEEAPFIERMTFLFRNTTDDMTTVTLWWEKIQVSFDVSVDTQELTLKHAREQVSWVPAFQAASYCLSNNVNLEEGMKWIKSSVLINEVYWNTRILAQFQHKLGMKNEAIGTMEKAIKLGSKMESAPFDFDAMKKMLLEWK